MGKNFNDKEGGFIGLEQTICIRCDTKLGVTQNLVGQKLGKTSPSHACSFLKKKKKKLTMSIIDSLPGKALAASFSICFH